jgi:hypothetical protein
MNSYLNMNSYVRTHEFIPEFELICPNRVSRMNSYLNMNSYVRTHEFIPEYELICPNRVSRKVSLLSEIKISHKELLSCSLRELVNGGNPLPDNRTSHDWPTALKESATLQIGALSNADRLEKHFCHPKLAGKQPPEEAFKPQITWRVKRNAPPRVVTPCG